jgi:hypothetical protein
MTVSRDFLAKLDAARDALSHSHPGASRDQIIEAGLDLILERTAKRRGLVKNPRKKAPASAAPSAPETATPAPAKDPGRYVPADVRRAIWERDQGKCQWPIEGGGICGATCRAELDHASKPFAKGGRILKPEEGRVLCGFHQDVSARREFGDDLMNSYTRPKAGTCSEPVAVYAASHRTERSAPGVDRLAPQRQGCGSVRVAARPAVRRDRTGACPSDGPRRRSRTGSLTHRAPPGHHADRTRVGGPAHGER